MFSFQKPRSAICFAEDRDGRKGKEETLRLHSPLGNLDTFLVRLHYTPELVIIKNVLLSFSKEVKIQAIPPNFQESKIISNLLVVSFVLCPLSH